MQTTKTSTREIIQEPIQENVIGSKILPIPKLPEQLKEQADKKRLLNNHNDTIFEYTDNVSMSPDLMYEAVVIIYFFVANGCCFSYRVPYMSFNCYFFHSLVSF